MHIGNKQRLLGQELLAIYERWTATINARKNSAIWKVLPLLLSQPAVSSLLIQLATGLSQPGADKVINQLHEAGVLAKASGAQRYRVWIASDVTDALDAFADRARRQGL